MATRAREKQVSETLRAILIYIMATINAAKGSFIAAEDVYTNSVPFTLSVLYTNNMSSPTSLTCKTVDQNSGLTAPPIELPAGSTNKKVSVTFSGTLNTDFPLHVSCSVGEQTLAQTTATVSDTEKILGLCSLDKLYPDPISGKVDVHVSPESPNQPVCSCNNDAGNTVLKNFVLKTDTKYVYTAEFDKANCNDAVCPCTLDCSYTTASGTKVSARRKVQIMLPELYIASSFTKLTLFKNTSTITVVTNPPSNDASCFANKVNINTFIAQDFNKDASFTDIVLEMSTQPNSNPVVYHVFPKDSTVQSGVYGIKCTSASSSASDTFLFEFENSKASNIDGEKYDFEGYVSVPCSCDQTPGLCDSRCCCDPDCSDIQKTSFTTCIPGPAGGDHTVKITPSCSDVSNVSPWERALCIKTSNSAFLGRYFNFVNKRSSTPSFTAENHWKDSFIAESVTPSTKSSKGSPIVVHSSMAGKSGFLTLPGRIGEACISAQPLRLLENTHASCSRVVVENCNMEYGGVFSARSYISPTNPTVDPCEWFTRVYSNGVGSTDAIINVLYKKNGEIINNQTPQILGDQVCKYAVTDVNYQVYTLSGVVISITATITLQDLRIKVGNTVVTTYTVNYRSADLNSVVAKKISPDIGYKRHDPLLVSSGMLKLPRYGSCDDIAKTGTTPQFRVSTIVQCYKIITENNVKQNCSALYSVLQASYLEMITNGTLIGSTPGNKTLVPVLQTNPLDISNYTETEMCDHLPSHLHIRVYHKNSTVSGEEVTNVTFSVEHGSVALLSGDKFLLQTDLVFLMSDVPDKRCVLCWEDVVQFFQNKQDLLNSLIVIFAVFVYFAIPKNLFSSRL